MFSELDPVQLLYRIREAQRLLTILEISGHSQNPSAVVRQKRRSALKSKSWQTRSDLVCLRMILI
jgi:hypothetical protein